METIALLSRADLLDILRKVVDFEAIYLKQMDVMEELTKNNEYRQRELMRTLGDANLKISQAETNSQKLNEIIGDLRDEIKNLKNSLKNCREFRDSVIKLRIDKPEEPRDLEGLDVTALIKEIIDLQRKLKALGIRYEEAVKNDQTFDTDSELSEDLEFQNPRQQILDLRAALADVRAALKRCNEAHEEVVDNTEDAASIAILKEGVQKLRDEHDETRDKLRLCEDEVDRLIKELRKQLDSRERDLKNEKEQAEKQAEREARYEHAITVLVDAAKEDKDFYEAKIQRLNDLEKNASTSQGANSGNVEQLQEQLAQIEAELQAEKKKAAASNKAAAKSFSSLEKEKQKTAKCERKLTDLRAQHPTTGLGNGKSSRKRSASKAHDSEPDEECLEDCVAELAKLKHEIAGFKVERARLKAQLREQGDETDNYEEGARWSKRHKQQLSEEWVNGEDDEGEEQDDLQPLEDNNFDPHNGTCNDEIEALNNQITAQKQELAALEQQAELDKLQIDALKHGNTDKSKAHQKFAALIEKLRTELEALQARLAECKSTFPSLSEES
jgi:chromosome segregation ATPase